MYEISYTKLMITVIFGCHVQSYAETDESRYLPSLDYIEMKAEQPRHENMCSVKP